MGCRRAKSSERFQSSPVIVLKSGPPGRVGEGGAADSGGLSGEGILHWSGMRGTSAPADSKAMTVCRQVIRTGDQPGATVPSAGDAVLATTTLSTLRLSISETSNRQPAQSK